ncbi:hypothetical protein [Caulobacter hibisci]|uniref:DUF2147 domain-containing protein n=1 Tax=Caulobacter hibisci TaxID=2035993 RepID=A0ABS0T5Q1_9CAUL|nr:hypothetical protein [Caulobacter hibisci]MBI1686430.1 hypothetical protein [Caulobacter hibisci]
MAAHLYDRAPLAWLATFAALGSASPVGAQPVNAVPCNLGVAWQLTHADGAIVRAKIEQQGSRFRGGATGSTPLLTGNLYDGRVKGRVLSFHIRWSTGQASAYRGYILPDGRVEGSLHDLHAPGRQQPWILKQRVRC